MNTIIITKTKYKNQKQKIENTLTTYGLKQITKNTYTGKITKEETEQIKKELQTTNQKQNTIIIIPICQKCYNNIQQIGNKINLQEEKYVIL